MKEEQTMFITHVKWQIMCWQLTQVTPSEPIDSFVEVSIVKTSGKQKVFSFSYRRLDIRSTRQLRLKGDWILAQFAQVFQEK